MPTRPTHKMMRDQLTLTFPDAASAGPRTESIGDGAFVLRGFASSEAPLLLADIEQVISVAPLRHMTTPGGFRMSVAMTNCGALGWVSDQSGYRYDPLDPDRGCPWPEMPASFSRLATAAASCAGFGGFVAEACLVNRYEPGARLTLHQDKNERDLTAPIVSVSLGIPAVFLFGGSTRTERPRKVRLNHGDVAVWGGPARLHYHGVLPLEEATHPLTGPFRINLTFRKVSDAVIERDERASR